ncbi:MAG: DNA polymerase III subunit epsilon [Burkholderiaceae bacterium]|jgi:DNA polymerase-3 subunit epsilon|nr:DNA polymerase III subunit epsilon [Burkholderiaceae bacterium]
MRQIVLDTETTGLSAEDGHRIIEIGCVEIVDRRLTGRSLHLYVNPEREIDEGALAVHGLTRERLESEPRFADVAERLLEFVRDAEILIHNAPFDLSFLDAELGRLRLGPFADVGACVIDTLAMARELHPGRRNSLDTLCERYGVSNAHRKLHGALLDAELLADVYLAMTRGQDSLEIAIGPSIDAFDETGAFGQWPPPGLVVLRASDDELRAHRELLDAIAAQTRKPALWSVLDSLVVLPAPAAETTTNSTTLPAG